MCVCVPLCIYLCNRWHSWSNGFLLLAIQKYLKIRETVREREKELRLILPLPKQVVWWIKQHWPIMMCLNISDRQLCYANEMLTDLRHTFHCRYRRSKTMVGIFSSPHFLYLVKMISTRRIQLLLFDKSVIFFGCFLLQMRCSENTYWLEKKNRKSPHLIARWKAEIWDILR